MPLTCLALIMPLAPNMSYIYFFFHARLRDSRTVTRIDEDSTYLLTILKALADALNQRTTFFLPPTVHRQKCNLNSALQIDNKK